jgi:hypothetical protein
VTCTIHGIIDMHCARALSGASVGFSLLVKKGSTVDVRKRTELIHFEMITDVKDFTKLHD